jgi:hypothetical protein
MESTLLREDVEPSSQVERQADEDELRNGGQGPLAQARLRRGPFQEPPTFGQLQDYRRFIRETAEPEQLGVLSWTRPPRSLRHELYHPAISVERARRPEGKMVPCSLCSGGHPKCLTFYLMWSSDGHLRVVGHVCGPKYFGVAAFRQLKADAERRFFALSDENFLLEELRAVAEHIRDLDLLAEPCRRLHERRREIQRDGPTLVSLLRRTAKDNNGTLVVQRLRSDASPAGLRSSTEGGSRYEDEPVAKLQGRVFLAPSFDPVRRLQELRSPLAAMLRGRQAPLSEDDVLQLVIELPEEERRKAVKAIASVRRRAIELRRMVREAGEFLSAANINGVARWAFHPDNPGIRVEEGRGSYRFILQGERVTLRPMEPLGELPMPSFERYVP